MHHRRVFVFAALAALLVASHALADHGPGTSGGGASTQSGETLKPGKVSLDLRFDWTEFQNVTQSDINAKATKGGNFDFLDRSFVTTASLGVGIVEDLQASLTWGYYDAVGAGEGELNTTTGAVETSTFNPDGFTDLWLGAKWRFARGPSGNWAFFAGEKFPVGRNEVRNSAGEFVEPSATAGSGSYDTLAGFAYSVYLSERVSFDTSVQYTLRTEADHFKVGDRVDVGAAVAYRLVDDVKEFPQWSVFGEVLLRRLEKSEDHGDTDPNTGGTVLFLSPGVRFSPEKDLTVTVAPQFPVLQDLNGEQLKTDFRLVVAVNFSF